MTRILNVRIIITEEDDVRTVDVVMDGKSIEAQDSGMPYDSARVFNLVEEEDWGLDVTFVPCF